MGFMLSTRNVCLHIFEMTLRGQLFEQTYLHFFFFLLPSALAPLLHERSGLISMNDRAAFFNLAPKCCFCFENLLNKARQNKGADCKIH